MRGILRRLSLLWAALLLVGACGDTQIQGSSRLFVGQRIELQLEAGADFEQNVLTIVDSAGNTFAASDPAVDYRYESPSLIVFTVPPGIAAGAATITVGASGRSDYQFDVTITRLLGVLDITGELRFHELDPAIATDNAFTQTTVGAGPGALAMSPSGGRVAAIAQGPGVIHFLAVGDPPLPFAPSIELGIPLGRGAMLEAGLVVPGAPGLGYVVQRDSGELVLERWFGEPSSVAVAFAPGVALAVAAANGAANDLLFKVTTDGAPDTFGPPIDLPGTPGGVTDVAILPGGEAAFALNSTDNLISTIDIPSPAPVAVDAPLPANDLGPSRIVVSPNGERVAVLCADSGTVAVYTVSGGTISHANSTPADPSGAQPPAAAVDLAFTAPARLHVLLANGQVSSANLDDAGNPLVANFRSPATSAASLMAQP